MRNDLDNIIRSAFERATISFCTLITPIEIEAFAEGSKKLRIRSKSRETWRLSRENSRLDIAQLFPQLLPDFGDKSSHSINSLLCVLPTKQTASFCSRVASTTSAAAYVLVFMNIRTFAAYLVGSAASVPTLPRRPIKAC